MKKAKSLVPLVLKKALLPKSIRATVFLCEEISGVFGKREVDAEKVGHSMAEVIKI